MGDFAQEQHQASPEVEKANEALVTAGLEGKEVEHDDGDLPF